MGDVLRHRTVDDKFAQIPNPGMHDKRQMEAALDSIEGLIRSLDIHEQVALKMAERAKQDMEAYNITQIGWSVENTRMYDENFSATTYRELRDKAEDAKRKLLAALGQ